ncbi:MAG: hypothetical protein SPF89_00775 [Sphaerochaetaceae bacterium]|nr:hypothetical protein [Spirochaetales bacterium]MDY5498617.1 hypothetical protein [Sphaerochaetaceae bacterium]
MDFTQDLLFSLSSSLPVSGEPCSLCKKAIGGEPCDNAGSCGKYLLWLDRRRTQIHRIAKATDRNTISICHTCPVCGVCPVSFEESLSFCPVKRQAVAYMVQKKRRPL